MYCKKCGKEIEEGAKFCTYCGNKIEEKDSNDTYNKKIRWILFAIFLVLGIGGLTNSWTGIFYILGAFTVSPIYIELLLLKKVNIKIVKLSSIILSIILIVVGLEIPYSPTITKGNEYDYNYIQENLEKEDNVNTIENIEIIENTKNDEDEANTEILEDESFHKGENIIENTELTNKDFGEELINNLTSLGFTVEEATEIQSIFYQIGINSISNVQASNNEGIDKLTATVERCVGDEQKKFWFTIEKRKLIYAGFRDETLFDSSKGGVLKNINDVHIPETKVDMETYTTLQVEAENAVKQYLNYPDTASFPLYDGWGIARNDDEYKIHGIVNAKNGFGVEDKIYFSVWFKKIDNQFNVEAVELNGVRVK